MVYINRGEHIAEDDRRLREKETVVVKDDNAGLSAGAIVALVIVFLLILFLLIGFPSGGTNTDDGSGSEAEVQVEVPAGGGASQ